MILIQSYKRELINNGEKIKSKSFYDRKLCRNITYIKRMI